MRPQILPYLIWNNSNLSSIYFYVCPIKLICIEKSVHPSREKCRFKTNRCHDFDLYRLYQFDYVLSRLWRNITDIGSLSIFDGKYQKGYTGLSLPAVVLMCNVHTDECRT